MRSSGSLGIPQWLILHQTASVFWRHRDYSSYRFDIGVRFWRIPLGTGDRILRRRKYQPDSPHRSRSPIVEGDLTESALKTTMQSPAGEAAVVV